MIDKVISHYRIIEQIGSGGMGKVYLAEDTKLERQVALKFLPAQFSADEEERKRFIHEAKAASALDHPNICSVYEIGETPEGQLFIVMGYYEGKTLKEKIKAGPLPVNEAVSLAVQVAEGLQEAHRKGIVHRDLKPANIMLTEQGVAKIVDFGLAKLKGLTRLTKSGTTLGTVAYMSPEQAQGKEVDQRTDIWSLGVILYEMLTGKLPFPGEYDQAVLYAVINEEPESLSKLRIDIPDELKFIVSKALAKRPENRYQAVDELLKELKRFQRSITAPEAATFNFRRFLLQPKIVVPALLVIAVISAAAIWYFQRQANIRRARYELLPRIERLVETGFEKYADAYKLATEAERHIPANPKLSEILSKISLRLSIRTEPTGAKVFMKGYNEPDGEWRYLGLSPIEKIRLPIGFFRWKMEKEGYETVLAAGASHALNWSEKWIFVPSDMMRVLDKRGDLPAGMVRVPGRADVPGVGRIGDFFMDRCEVTNRQFKEFVDGGGYQNKAYWKEKFVKQGRERSREQALKEFVDQTGRPGPSAWQAGDYPEGQGDFPVSGISWYEAAAYAEWAGKSLPTSHHWGIACGEYTSTPGWWNYLSLLAPLSNFKGRGPARVGSFAGMTAFGNYDMAGNVREWCWNETPHGRVVRGGAWDDATYMFAYISQASPFDRSPKTGFRCVRYIDKDMIPGTAFAAVQPQEEHDLEKMKPASDEVFSVYKELFLYDKTDLQVRREWRNEKSSDWIQEKVSFTAGYGNERVIAYLFLPKNSRPPFQTVIFYPGSAVEMTASSNDLEKDFQFDLFLSFIVKNGRAVLYPVLKGTFERGNWSRYQVIDSDISTREFSEWVILEIKDFLRCLDYLDTRSDIDPQKLAYMGYSAGAWLAPIVLALDHRIKAGVLQNGGFIIYFMGTGPIRPEINQMNYVMRVKTPILMLNGKYDIFFPYETNAKIMFDLLGTPGDRKKQKVYDSDHYVPRNELIKETLAWLDKYLGPVRR
jgi:eukaryotic-like serine/threonine-protein kinase